MGTKNSATVKADKAKVDKAIIIVSGTKEEPYFEILYHLLGEDDDRIGFWIVLFNQCIQLERSAFRYCK